jgi:WD40 repeat protein
MKKMANPYVGPRTFEEKERDRFFGREREARELLALTVSGQLVLFYAQSGAGKSSLINTCLIPDLKRKGFKVFPVVRVAGDIPIGLQVENIYVFNLIRKLASREDDEASLANLTLPKFIAQQKKEPISESAADDEEGAYERRVLIIDQFEELFNTHQKAWEKRQDFFEQLAQAMRDDPYLWVVLVMREDYVAPLEPYVYLLPGRLRMRYYMQRLSREAALKAIKGPVERLRPYANDVAEGLVDDLSSIKVQNPDGSLDVQPGQFVEPVQLQVVCYDLWENLADEGNQITEQDVQKVGDVNTSLGNYYARRVKEVAEARTVSERKIREWIEEKLIAPGGMRNMILQESSEKSSGLENSIIQLLSDLIRAEQRGGAIFYELTHDRLVEPIIENNRRWDIDNSSPFRSQAEAWKKSGNEIHLVNDQSLITAKQWAATYQDKLNATETDFLKASQIRQKKIEEERELEIQRQEIERQNQQEKLRAAQELAEVQTRSARKARQYTFIAIVLTLIAISATFFALLQLNAANEQKTIALQAESDAKESETMAKDQADIARISELSTIALDRAGSEIDLAILLGLQADSIKSNTRTQNTLLAVQQKSGRFAGIIKQGAEIQQVLYSPDGEIFASRGENGILFWDAKTLKPLSNTPINGHFSGVSALTISQDGKLMASGASNGTIVVWDAEKHVPLSEPFKAHNGKVDSLVFTRDGQALVSASSDEFPIIVWDISNPIIPQQLGEPLANHVGGILSLALHPDGATLASSSYDQTIILWDLASHQAIGIPFGGDEGSANQIAFSDDGTIIAAISNDSKIVLWEVQELSTPTKISELQNGTGSYVRGLAISPANQILALGESDGSITLWDFSDAENPEKVQGSELNQEPGVDTWRLAFSADGKTLAATAFDGSIILWDVPSRKRLRDLPRGDSNYVLTSAIIFGEDGKSIITSSYDSKISYWDISDRKEPRKTDEVLQGHPGQPSGMSFSPDGSLLTSFGDDGTILLDARTPEEIGPGSFYSSPDGNILAYQIADGITEESMIYLRDSETGQNIGSPIAGQNPVFSPDSKKLLFKKLEKNGRSALHLLDIATHEEIMPLKFGQFVAFSPNSRLLVYQTTDSATGQTSLNLWDTATSRNLGGTIDGLFWAFSRDSQTLVYQTRDEATNQTLYNLWDIVAAHNLAKDIPGSYIGFSSDSRTFIYQTFNSKTAESVINTWNIGTASRLKNFSGTNPLLSSDGKVLAFIANDPVSKKPFVNVLDLVTGNARIQPVEGWSINVLSANGNIMVYSSTDAQGNWINVLNTKTGEKLFSVLNSYMRNRVELNQIIAHEFYNSSSGESNILLIDTTTGQKIGEPIKGTYLHLSQDGEILIYQTLGDINLHNASKNAKIGEPIPGSYMAISQDGKILVTRSQTNTIIFWDVTKTWPFGDPLMKVSEIVVSAALSRDGSTLAWADKEGITVQEITNDVLISEPFMNHFENTAAISLTISPNGKFIAVLSIDEDATTPTTTVWDITKGKQIGPPIPEAVFATFSPDSKFLFTIKLDDQPITTVWELNDPTQLKAIGDPITGVVTSFSPDSKTAIFGDFSQNSTLKIWDLVDHKLVNDSIPGEYATLSPDGKMLAVIFPSSENASTILWDLSTFEKIGDPIPGGAWVSFSPDGKSLAVGNLDDSTTIWDLATRKPTGNPIPGGLPIHFGQNGNFLVVAGENFETVSLWDLKERRPIFDSVSGNFNSDILTLPYAGSSSDGSVFAFYDNNQNALLWNTKTNTQLNLPEYPGRVLGISLNQHGAFFVQSNLAYSSNIDILAIYGDKGIMLWDLKNSKVLGNLLPVNLPVAPGIPATNVMISQDGKIVASFANGVIVLRDLETNVDTQLKYSGRLTGNMIFSKDNTRLTALSEDNILMSWDVATGEQNIPTEQPLKGLSSIITSLFSPDGKYLVYKSSQNNSINLHIWDVLAGEAYLETPIQLKNFGGAVAFSSDGTLLAYSDGAEIILYKVGEKEQVGVLLTGLNELRQLSMIMDGDRLKYLISADLFGATQIWDWATRTKIGDPISGSLRIVGENSQDHIVIYVDSSARLIKWKWDLDHTKWKELLCPLARRNLTREEWSLYFPAEEYPSTKDLLTCPEYPAGR